VDVQKGEQNWRSDSPRTFEKRDGDLQKTESNACRARGATKEDGGCQAEPHLDLVGFVG
jgi:hypothetical protein